MRALAICVFFLALTQGFSYQYPPYWSWVVPTSPPSLETENTVTKNDMGRDLLHLPEIKALEITTDITNRYAKTTYKSSVINPANITQEITFFVVTPNEAYITSFIMNIDGKDYNATVKEKKTAENIYNEAVNTGHSAAHVAVSTRNSNKFTVSVNVGADSTVVFYLTCEELLKRKSEKYYHTTNINPKQLIETLNITVNIHESVNLTTVEILPLSCGDDMNENNEKLTVRADIVRDDSKSAKITFNPTIEEQKKYAAALKTPENEGISGQFIISYDVERNNNGGEILIEDGYFTHFFAPANLPVKPKYLIFVVDTSGSMSGRRIEQLRDALRICLKNLNPDDRITIIEFNSDIKVYNLDAFDESTLIKLQNNWGYNQNAATYREHQVDYSKLSFPPAYPPTEETIQKALNAVDKMEATTSTNIYESLRAALHMVRLTIERTKFSKGPERQPMILFCTDGEPTDGLTNINEIVREVTNQNIHKVPIFSMSFGEGCDKEFLRSVSSQNYGMSRHIYEASDSALQIHDFYKQISSPLLTNVTFRYTDNVTEYTTNTFPILFRGEEFVVSGRINNDAADIMPIIECGVHYPYTFVPEVKKVKIGNIERQWAYLTTQQYLEKKETAKALKLALDYSFVTSLTSMVVVKPNATEQVSAVDAKSNIEDDTYGSAGSYAGYAGPFYTTMASMAMSNSYFGTTDVFDDMFEGAFDTYASTPMQQYTTDMEPMGTISSVDYGYPTMQQENQDNPTGSSPSPIEVTTPKVPMVLPENISKAFPFLQECITTKDTINFLKGDYKFGFNRSNTTVSNSTCTTLASEPGKCKFMDEATAVYGFITDILSFQQFFCVVNNEFVGLCCDA